MNPIFGELWDAPICEDATRIATPVGEPCAWCTVPLAEGDRGHLIPCGMADGTAKMLPWHRECFMRSSIGSPAHLRGSCTCHEPDAPDTPSTPAERRAEALESWRLWLEAGTFS